MVLNPQQDLTQPTSGTLPKPEDEQDPMLVGPPPPPPAPGGTELQSIQTFGVPNTQPAATTMQATATPTAAATATPGFQAPAGSRFNMPMLRATTDLINQSLDESLQRDIRDHDEFMSARGTIGSNIEDEGRTDIRDNVATQRRQRMNDLQMMVAQTMGEDTSLANEMTRFFAGLGEGQRQFDTSAGFTQQQLDTEVARLQQEAALQGRSLDLTEARQQAEHNLAQQQLAQQQTQFESQMTQRQAEFAAQHGLAEAEFAASMDQFAQQMAEQTAARLQQASQFAESLADTQAARAMEADLRNRALDLQEQGMTLDEAFRQAQLEQEGAIQQRALDLEEQGLQLDDAYRYAALDQDAEFHATVEERLREGMALDEAYRQTELAWRQQYGEEELDVRRQEGQDAQRMQTLTVLMQALASGVEGLDAARIEELLRFAMGGDDGPDSATFICTALHDAGILPDEVYRADVEYGAWVRAEDPDLFAGYAVWAGPVSRAMRKRTWFGRLLTRVGAAVAVPWAYEMAYRTGKGGKSSLRGRLVFRVYPLARALGRLTTAHGRMLRVGAS